MHPKYHNHLLKCQFIDDCVAGTSAIKHGQSDFDYLPMYPSECDGVSVGQQYYALRKRMSHYEPVILRLINECVGMMCMNEPVIGFGVNDDTESAEEVRDIRYNGTLQKDGLSGLKVRTCRFVLQHGRYLLLLDSVGESGTNRAEFRVLEYKAASILDGDMTDDGRFLRWLLIDESTDVFNHAEKKWETLFRWRVAGVDATGHYYSSLLEGTKIEVEQKWQEFDLLTPPEEITVWPAFRGDYLTFIPATIVNLTNQGVHGYEDPPFLDVAHTSIEAYNLSSLYVCALQKNAQPTIVGVNVNPAMVKTEITNSDGTKGTKEIPIPLTLGGAIWFKSPPGGTASQSSVNMLETSGAGAEIGESSIEIPVSYDGTDVTVRLDPKFVIEFARSLPADKLVTVRLDAAGERPVLFTTDDSCRYVVMPLA